MICQILSDESERSARCGCVMERKPAGVRACNAIRTLIQIQIRSKCAAGLLRYRGILDQECGMNSRWHCRKQYEHHVRPLGWRKDSFGVFTHRLVPGTWIDMKISSDAAPVHRPICHTTANEREGLRGVGIC